ncbi:Rid family detoxifying hydrolase [Mesoplasma seiffertii]|uniref:Rid family detoxifying hydrolase n=1 Tax=Mesoplasma seiffertii TaxID=28224 RepID=UPI00047AAFDD|nr:Rid family detoxifying hydrolase [Mesoplasma seiffertii]
MKMFNTKNAPAAVGPYSQAVILDDKKIFVSGQLGFDLKTMTLPEHIEQQTLNILENIDNILNDAGYTKRDIFKTTIMLKNIDDFLIVNEIYSNFFEDHKPARSCFEVSNLPKEALIEIEVIAQY